MLFRSTVPVPPVGAWSPAALPAGTPCGTTVQVTQTRTVPPGCTQPTTQQVPVTAPPCPVNCVLGTYIDDPVQTGDRCVSKTQTQTVTTPAQFGGTCNPGKITVPTGVGAWSPPPATVPPGTPCGQTFTVPQTRTVPPGCPLPATQTSTASSPACPPPCTQTDLNNFGSNKRTITTPVNQPVNIDCGAGKVVQFHNIQ